MKENTQKKQAKTEKQASKQIIKKQTNKTHKGKKQKNNPPPPHTHNNIEN